MGNLRSVLLGVSLVLCRGIGLAGEQGSMPEALPDAATIMARVAANQDRADEERRHYVYVQHAHVTSRKGKTVMCDEVTDFRITPSASGSHAELLRLKGRVMRKQDYFDYTTLLPNHDVEMGHPETDHSSTSITIGIDDTDRELVENMRSNLTADNSKDGIDTRLFPLTSDKQREYDFHLAGRERMNGRDVFHIRFQPKDKSEFGWKGDAYIDAATFEPVVVNTDMSRKVPMAVRTLLGTNVPGLGFSVTYAPRPDGVWFPASFATEFKLHILFFFRRDLTLDVENRDFEKTHVDARIVEN